MQPDNSTRCHQLNPYTDNSIKCRASPGICDARHECPRCLVDSTKCQQLTGLYPSFQRTPLILVNLKIIHLNKMIRNSCFQICCCSSLFMILPACHSRYIAYDNCMYLPAKRYWIFRECALLIRFEFSFCRFLSTPCTLSALCCYNLYCVIYQIMLFSVFLCNITYLLNSF